MAILKLKDKPRAKPYRVRVGNRVKMFRTLDQAKRWERFAEDSLAMTGLPPTIDELRKFTVKDLVQRYLKDVTPTKKSAANEQTVLAKSTDPKTALGRLCLLSLAAVRKEHAAKYRDERLKETWCHPNWRPEQARPITPRTVRREVNVLHHVFSIARDEWGFEQLKNPFDGLHIKGSMHRRTRRLEPGELQRLIDAATERCLGLNRLYVPLATMTAAETGMRLQEIFNLKFSDVDLKERTINIRKSKTDHLQDHDGRVIVLPPATTMLFSELKRDLTERFGLHKIRDAPVFLTNKRAFQQAWADVVRNAGSKNLTFHDLRREAGSRFEEAGLTGGERDHMLGHRNKDMRSLYSRAHLKNIRDKLDKHLFKGKTLAEVLAEAKDDLERQNELKRAANTALLPIKQIGLRKEKGA